MDVPALSDVRSAGLALGRRLTPHRAHGWMQEVVDAGSEVKQTMTVQDPQARCDALYQLAASSRWASLVGKSSHDIAELLGRPDRIATLVHEGVTWTRIVYVCEPLPARASTEERSAHGRGWRFTPSLLLRDGIAVSEATFEREVSGGRRAAIPPPELEFHEGGRFP